MIITKGLLRNVQTRPEKIAVIDGDKQFTYRQLANRSARLKEALQKMGIQKGNRVAVLMLNSFRYLELMYGVTALGALIVPLNYRLSPEELMYILQDSGAKVLFLHREFVKVAPLLKKEVPSLLHYVLAEDEEIRELGLESYEDWIQQATDQPLRYADDLHEDDVAGLFYTGGTTGRAKGVMLTHRNLISNYYHAGVLNHQNPDSRFLHAAPMFHLADGMCMISITNAGGSHCVIRAFSAKGFMKAVDTYKVTNTLLVPTMLNMVLNDPDYKAYDLHSLEKVTYGAAPMPYELLKRAMQEFPNIKWTQGYGMTEASPGISQLSPDYHVLDDSSKNQRRLFSAGHAVMGVEVRIVDELGNELPVGQVGEIIARGPNIMKGYWNLPEETAAVLKNGWYHTGDMGYLDEDYFLYVVDRKKDMIISGGENIYSPEVENIIYQHPDVVEVAVIGAPDPTWGEIVLAAVVKKKGSQMTEQEIVDFMRGRVASYKIPKRIEFMEELPKSGAGKILKRHLRSLYWKDMPRQVN
ncbi:long-chain-fatty-acid--CoA ligase [Brevibacillus invocatus]|uniref:Long-chain-fatty-acid--CoA ligase n=1 Tax=Brevibacillus invocatus TaxID=173959 RepID=A0A3M8CK32_9BACL|nr:long-chain-fatty-acid--CoA ligase [Brevibacillus invocatus]RNB75225.1 long-chain-fatty-acid--CoA ligase [Brevibacillus invocatus]